MTIHLVVLGGAGYVGAELLRLAAGHPDLVLGAAVSDRHAGSRIGTHFSHLAPVWPDESFQDRESWPDTIDRGADVALFSAAPHGASADAVAAALELAARRDLNVRVVDVSADFRFTDLALYETVYGTRHSQPSLAGKFVCGVPEHVAGPAADFVGHPGCFTTATLLAVVPLVRAGLVTDRVFVTGITGSTGSGRDPKPGAHHPDRNSNLYAYQPLAHRHAPEMEALLAESSGTAAAVHFVPHSGPFARGIHVTVQAVPARDVERRDVEAVFRDAYADSAFVNVVDALPRVKDVVASNLAHIGVAVGDGSLAVMCVIDNLVKGAAGGALQWMNRQWKLPEQAGLTAPAPGWT